MPVEYRDGKRARFAVVLPVLPPTLRSGEKVLVHSWVKQVGDVVRHGEALFVVETSANEIEIPAPVTGVLAGICANRGTTLEVGQIAAYLVPLSPHDASAKAPRRANRWSPSDRFRLTLNLLALGGIALAFVLAGGPMRPVNGAALFWSCSLYLVISSNVPRLWDRFHSVIVARTSVPEADWLQLGRGMTFAAAVSVPIYVASHWPLGIWFDARQSALNPVWYGFLGTGLTRAVLTQFRTRGLALVGLGTIGALVVAGSVTHAQRSIPDSLFWACVFVGWPIVAFRVADAASALVSRK